MKGSRVNPGGLRHQITWQERNVTGQDSFGVDTVDYRNVVTLKAEVLGLEGRELAAAQQRWSEARYRITQHYYRGLDASMRLSWYVDGVVRTLDVLDIQDPAGTSRMQIVIAKDHIE